SAECSASSALLPVTTDFPLFNAVSNHPRTGSVPPINSTTRSASDCTSHSTSEVSNSVGSSGCRSGLRTAIPTSSTGAPTRAASSSECSNSTRATSAPTVPQPSSATRIVFPFTVEGTLTTPPGVRCPRSSPGAATAVTHHYVPLQQQASVTGCSYWPSNSSMRPWQRPRADRLSRVCPAASSPAPPHRRTHN